MTIKLYTKHNCGACDITKQWLDNNNLEYTTVNVQEDPDAMAEIQEKGYMQLPVVNVNDWETHWSGFEFQRLEGLL